MSFSLDIETDNAAFAGDNLAHELQRIMHHIIMKIAAGDTNGRVLDVNGNSVGTWSFSPPAEDRDDDEATFSIVRFFQGDRPREVIETGLSLAEAQRHCDDPTTSGDGWFDGYQAE